MRSIKILTIAFMLAGIFSGNKATAQIKIGLNGPFIAPASLLELESNSQGLLLPRMANTIAIDALIPPVGMMVYITDPNLEGIYVKKIGGWERLQGFLNGDATFKTVTVTGTVTAGGFSGPLTGTATKAVDATNSQNSVNSYITDDVINSIDTYPVFVNATNGNQPLKSSSGNLTYNPSTGILTAKGFNGPLVGDVTGNASKSVEAQNTVNMRITNDVLNPAVAYPTFVFGTSGPLPPVVANTKLSFYPLSGELNATTFRGALIGNASSATSVTGLVAAVNGGTGQTIYSPGDLLYANTSTSLAKLPIGVPGTVLRVNAGNTPGWSTAGAGTVINVTGTPNRITVTDPTVSPSLDIAATYAGQASIATVGTITIGTWEGKEVDVAHGGTGQKTLPAGRVLIGNGIGTVNAVDGDVPNLVLTSNGPGLAPTFKSPGAGDMVLNVDQTITGIKTFGQAGNVGKLVLAGNTSGSTILNGAAAGVGGTVVLPLTGTLATLAGTETLSNKTLTSPTLTNPNIGAAIGTTLVLGGGSPLGTTNQTGTGRIVMDNTPTLITPNIGVASGTSLNLGGGTVTAATFTGTANDVNNVNGVAAATVQAGAALANSSTFNNTNGTIVRRDGSGNFSATTITANLTGTASNATLATNATNAINAANTNITDDNAAATDNYPTFVNDITGNLGQRVSSGKLTYQPLTGRLTASIMKASTFESNVGFGAAPFSVVSATPVPILSIGGNAGTATKLAAAVAIYGANFDGTAALTGPVSGQFGGTGIDNTGKTIDINGGNFSTSGVGTLNLNTTAATNVTFPTGGTLYGTAPGSFASNDLITSLSDATGSGKAVFATSPSLISPIASSIVADAAVAYLATKNVAVGTGVQGGSVVSGTNLAGTVTIVIAGGAANEALLTVNYSSNFPTTSYPVLYPATATASALTGNVQVYAVGANNGFAIRSGTAPLPDGTYTWNYQVIGR